MRLATVVTSDGTSCAAVEADGTWHALPAPDLGRLLAAEAPSFEPGEALPGAVLTNPVPDPRKVVCCGLNYADHIAETGRERPQYPTLFAKYADTLIGPGEDIVVPAGPSVDWEAELTVVVGATLRGASRDEAAAAIAGYTLANDISMRDWQRRTLQWFQGKVWDRTTPVGPVVVTPDELDPRAGVEITCDVNGERVQRGDTANLVFDCADLLAYVSTFTVLRPGDLVLTGTPGGVGMAMDPPRFLADGDIVGVQVDGIGRLENRVRIQGPSPKENQK